LWPSFFPLVEGEPYPFHAVLTAPGGNLPFFFHGERTFPSPFLSANTLPARITFDFSPLFLAFLFFFSRKRLGNLLDFLRAWCALCWKELAFRFFFSVSPPRKIQLYPQKISSRKGKVPFFFFLFFSKSAFRSENRPLSPFPAKNIRKVPFFQAFSSSRREIINPPFSRRALFYFCVVFFVRFFFPGPLFRHRQGTKSYLSFPPFFFADPHERDMPRISRAF